MLLVREELCHTTIFELYYFLHIDHTDTMQVELGLATLPKISEM